MTLIWALFCPQKCRNCPQINDTYFYSIFHHERDLLSKKFAKGAHSGMFLAFRIYINFFLSYQIEAVTLFCFQGHICPSRGKMSCFSSIFASKFLIAFFQQQLASWRSWVSSKNYGRAIEVHKQGYSKISSKHNFGHWKAVKKLGATDATRDLVQRKYVKQNPIFDSDLFTPKLPDRFWHMIAL